jgi:hypothetical protein
MPDPTVDDRIAYIALSLYGTGAMSISGNIGDKRLALQMLDHARDTIRGQLERMPYSGLLVPPRDVEVKPDPLYPALVEAGDVSPDLRARLLTDRPA